MTIKTSKLAHARERRKPRAAFTRTLERLCRRLDERSTFDVEYTHRLFTLGKVIRARTAIRALWVAGSYARGVAQCGDLDLIIKTEKLKGADVPYRKLLRPAFGHIPDVRVYEGTPQQNSSGVPLPEAIEVWTPGSDWRTAIAAIRVNESAGRVARATDVIPLRAEQLGVEVDELESLVELHAKGVLAWRFLPIENAAAPMTCTDSEVRFIEFAAGAWGRRTQALAAHILWYLRQRRMPLIKWEHQSGATIVDACGSRVSLGRPVPQLDALSSLRCSALALLPHLSRRGPNGIWEIVRGTEHPLERAFAHCSAHVMLTEEGKLRADLMIDERGWSIAHIVELFCTEAASHRYIEERATEGAEEFGDAGVRVERHRGASLLELISCADILDVYRESQCDSFVMTLRGALVMGDETARDATAEAVLAAVSAEAP